MQSGGTRFTGDRPKAPPRVIDVDVRPRHETLYDALVLGADASTREIRRVAAALRRNHPDGGALHDICLAEQVLGRANLRTEYDALLARLRAAGQPVPKIGTAIEGSPLGPSLSTRFGSASRNGAAAAGRVFSGLLKVAFAVSILIGVCVAVGTSSKMRRDPYKLDIDRIQIPKFQPPVFDDEKFRRELDDLTRRQMDELDRQLRQTPSFTLPDPPKLEPPKRHSPSRNHSLPVAPSETRAGSSTSASTINK